MKQTRRVVIIGTGVGGLTAALRLSKFGYEVHVVEARGTYGGLAAGFDLDGFRFDAGPYVLLDRPGLEWAFSRLDLSADQELRLRRIDEVYEVTTSETPPVRIGDSLTSTADHLEKTWPGSGQRYRDFIQETGKIYERLQPLQTISRPGVFDVLRTGAWRHVPFLLKSLGPILQRTQLPPAVCSALGVWTHVAGQDLEHAPSPLAFVPTVIHQHGAWIPAQGIGAIADSLYRRAVETGIEFRFNAPVKSIRCAAGRTTGVEFESGEFLPADAVLANASGLGTCLNLLQGKNEEPTLPQRAQRKLRSLPLQSPGVAVYLAVREAPCQPYLRFHLPGGGERCRLLIQSGIPAPESARDGWFPARLIAPLSHERAETGGLSAQQEFLAQVLEETWWRQYTGEYRVLATRIPAEWGAQYHLYRDSMNPVMTKQFMREGRLAHRSPYVRGLYLAGSATHPGQWVSFCAISGILAADRIREDIP